MGKDMASTKRDFSDSDSAMSREEMTGQTSSEPPIEEGKKRIRWTCECGTPLWDDFRELQPGAAEKLRKQLDVHERIRAQSSSCSITNGQASLSLSPPEENVASQNTTFSSRVPSATKRKYPYPEGSANAMKIPGDAGQRPGDTDCIDKRFLLMILKKPNDCCRLVQCDVKDVKDDVQLFQLIKETHANYRRGISDMLFPVELMDIKFRKMEVQSRNRAIVYGNNDDVGMLPHRINPSACHPDHNTCDTSYDIDPTPPDLLPLIGDNGMKHLLSDAHEASHEGNRLAPQTVYLQRFPKKEKTELTICPPFGYGQGWAIEPIEAEYTGWLFKGIISALFLGSAIALLFIWREIHKNISDAASAIGIFLSFASLFIGFYQLMVPKKP